MFETPELPVTLLGVPRKSCAALPERMRGETSQPCTDEHWDSRKEFRVLEVYCSSQLPVLRLTRRNRFTVCRDVRTVPVPFGVEISGKLGSGDS